MTDIILNGLVGDRERMAHLCQAVAQLGYDCQIALWNEASLLSIEDSCDGVGDGPSEQATIEIICWTNDSVGSVAQALQNHAVALKEQQRYLGLLLDAVTPPEAVTGAQDIPLHGWDTAADVTALAPLREVLDEKLQAAPATDDERSAMAKLMDQLKALSWQSVLSQLTAIRDRIQRMHALLKTVGVFGVVTFMLAVFGFFGGLDQNVASVCKFGMMTGACRSAGIGDVPSQAELDEWARIEPGSSCEAFEHYRAKYGPGGRFYSDAGTRLEGAQPTSEETPLRIPRPISFAPDNRQRTRGAAIEALRTRAQAEAVSFCSTNAQNFDGEARPGIYTMSGEPNCVSDGERFDCEADGTIECAFMRSDQGETCPPLTARVATQR